MGTEIITPDDRIVALTEEIVSKTNWKKVARAVGESQEIHFDDEKARSFGFKEAVCPGVYILALAEKAVDAEWLYKKPRIIFGKFRDYLYDGSRLRINRNNKLILENESGGLVAMIEERDSSDKTKDAAVPEVVPKTVANVTQDDLALFYDGMNMQARNIQQEGNIPYAFAFGSAIKSLLETKLRLEEERKEEGEEIVLSPEQSLPCGGIVHFGVGCSLRWPQHTILNNTLFESY